MYNVAIVGASGYTGGELLRMLLNHSEVEVNDITSRKYDGTPAHKIHPHIRDSGFSRRGITKMSHIYFTGKRQSSFGIRCIVQLFGSEILKIVLNVFKDFRNGSGT